MTPEAEKVFAACEQTLRARIGSRDVQSPGVRAMLDQLECEFTTAFRKVNPSVKVRLSVQGRMVTMTTVLSPESD